MIWPLMFGVGHFPDCSGEFVRPHFIENRIKCGIWKMDFERLIPKRSVNLECLILCVKQP